MRRTRAAVALIASGLAVAALVVGLMRVPRKGRASAPSDASAGSRVDKRAVERLRSVPFYRGVLPTEALRSASLSPGGAVSVEVDLPALVRPRLVGLDLESLCDLLPRTARGTVRFSAGTESPGEIVEESWVFSGPAPLLEVLDREPERQPSAAWDAIPGAPHAIAAARLNALRLADDDFGGAALAAWRERAALAEKILGRPLRHEIAEDLAGPVIVALYETRGRSGAEALVIVELKRADRLRALLDTVFALGALTERGTIRRHHEVPTGSFRTRADGPGLALAVDGPVLLAATSRPLLESAIDARRQRAVATPIVERARVSGSSWSAVASSAFVAHGWSRLARVDDARDAAAPVHSARLVPEGAASWRLEGGGPSPAITTDPVLPFLRSVLGGRQRDAG